MRLLVYCFAAFAALTASASAAPIIVGGQLIGFSSVMVSGNLYDVALDTRSCAEVYSGCDEITDFPFSVADASTALNALADSISTPSDLLVPEITSIFNCEFPCFIAIADGLQGSAFTQSQFRIVAAGGLVEPVNRALGTDTSTAEIFAVFTPASEIPIPAALPLFLVGLAGLGFAKRKKAKI